MRDTIDFLSSAMELIESSGIDGLDGPWTTQTKELQRIHGSEGLALNRLWILTPPDWLCPCCTRSKGALVRLDQHRRLLGVLVEHHDHSDELIELELLQIAKHKHNNWFGQLAKTFVKRGANLLRGYDPVVICQDCNNVDPSAKKIVSTPQHFSFSTRQMSTFIEKTPNCSHKINSESVVRTWEEARPLFESCLALIRWLGQIALENLHWLAEQGKHSDTNCFELRAQELIDRLGPFILQPSMHEFVEVALSQNCSIARRIGRQWSQRRRITHQPRRPTDGEINAVAEISHRSLWQSVPANWVCPCCQRVKRDCVMPSAQFPWAFSLQPWAQLDAGKFTVDVCGECKAVASELAKEAGVRVRDVSPSDIAALLRKLVA